MEPNATNQYEEQPNPTDGQSVASGHVYTQREDGGTEQGETVTAPMEPATEAEPKPPAPDDGPPVVYRHESTPTEGGGTEQGTTVSAPAEQTVISDEAVVITPDQENPPVVSGHKRTQTEDGGTELGPTVSAPAEPVESAPEAVVTEQPKDSAQNQLADTGVEVGPMAALGTATLLGGIIVQRLKNRRGPRPNGPK